MNKNNSRSSVDRKKIVLKAAKPKNIMKSMVKAVAGQPSSSRQENSNDKLGNQGKIDSSDNLIVTRARAKDLNLSIVTF